MDLRMHLLSALSIALVTLPGSAPAAAPGGNPHSGGLKAVLVLQGVIAEKVGNPTAQAKIAEAIARLGELNAEEYEAIASVDAEAEKLASTLALLDQRLDELATKSSTASSEADALANLSRPLTPADYFNDASCASNGTERFDDLTVFISEQALFTAETVREEASRICDETIVILGEGGNTSLACIATDVIYIVAKETHNVLAFCDRTVDEAEIEGAFERAADIYHNLNEHDGNLALHDADIKLLLADLQDAVDENTRRLGEVIRLLHTPQGQRSSDYPVCDGGPCDFPYKGSASANGNGADASSKAPGKGKKEKKKKK